VSALRAYSQPLEVVLNFLCWETLLGLVTLPAVGLGRVMASFSDNDYVRKAAEWGAQGVITARTNMDMAAAAAVAMMGDRMDIVVDVHAPKVILPEDSGRDAGYFVVDLGRAQLNGSVNSVTGLALTLSMTSLCAGLPKLHKEIYKYGESGVYFIRPVDVRAEFTAIAAGRFQSEAFARAVEGSNAPPDLKVDMQLRSELQIMLDAPKVRVDLVLWE
jgi:hypothetical protein